MSSFYHPRPYNGGGPVPKKPRMGGHPRGHLPMMGGGPVDYNREPAIDRFMTFKEYMNSQPDNIHEQDAILGYSNYKAEYTRVRIEKFFKEHQDEEWFRNKYRPTEINKNQEAAKECKSKRKELFNKLMEKHSADNLSLEYDNSESIARFLENFSLLLEGATIEDLDNIDEARVKFGLSALYVPAVHPSIDKAMIEECASKNENFLRVAMSEAQPALGFSRRAWITYKHMDINSLRKLIWDLNLNRYNGQEIKTNINKELQNQVRTSAFWFRHVDVAKADLKNVAKLLNYFDGDDCPLLESIKNLLIEESNVEEQVLGINEQNVQEFEFTEDQEILKTLDKVLLYLRVVHSYDYYVSTEYAGEDDMPQKVGLIHVRPYLPTIDKNRQILKDFIQAHQARIDAFIEKPTVSEIEQKQLGKRNPDEQVENFIYSHTIEKKSGEKYICKLTKKKFTGPEYVRKHIISKCGDKLDEVRNETEFFNNYVADPKRPM